MKALNLLSEENVVLLEKPVTEELEEVIADKSPRELPPSKSRMSIIPPVERQSEFIVGSQESVPIVIPFKSGRRAKLIVPENVSNEELDKILKFIEALRE